MASTTVRNHTRHTKHGSANVRRHTRRVSYAERVMSATNGAKEGLPASVGLLGVMFVSALVWALTAVMSVTAAIMWAIASLALMALGMEAHAGKRKRTAARSPAGRKPARPAALSRRRRFRLWRHKQKRRWRRVRHPLHTARVAVGRGRRRVWAGTQRRAEARWAGRRISDPA